MEESSAVGYAPLDVTSPARSCISQACVVEWVSGGDGQESWPVTYIVPLYPLIFQCVS